jgi:hypothetical protein
MTRRRQDRAINSVSLRGPIKNKIQSKSTMKSKRVAEKKIAVGGEGQSVMKTYLGGSAGVDDAPGLKVGPVTVLIGSLIFIFVVIVLHFYGRLFR